MTISLRGVSVSASQKMAAIANLEGEVECKVEHPERFPVGKLVAIGQYWYLTVARKGKRLVLVPWRPPPARP